jgi:alkyldihydroxyacetonephosphate synthase
MEALASLVERLPAGIVSTHHGELGAHAHDRWALALLRDIRGDRVPPPAAIVYPTTTAEVATVLAWAQETRTPVVARGGGSGLTGGAEALKRSVMVELSRLNRVVTIDAVSQTVTAQAGVRGGELEAALAPHGLTVGFDPVSLDISTVGGWVASGATGVASAGYGGVRELLVGLTVVLAGGTVVELPPMPRTASGPDPRRVFVASGGAFGVVTEATLAASRLPSGHLWDVFTPNSFESGLALVREIAQRPYRPLVVRLHDPAEAASSFSAFGFIDRPLLFVGLEAGAPGSEAERFELNALAREFGARQGDPEAARQWWSARFDGVRWYDEVMGPDRPAGLIVDIADFGAVWRKLPRLYEEVRGALLDHAETVMCRLTDASITGAGLLFTFIVRAADDREVEDRYLATWDAAAKACLDAGGTITNNHGVGLLKAPYVEGELGAGGTALLHRIKEAMDPAWILNPGKVLPPE